MAGSSGRKNLSDSAGAYSSFSQPRGIRLRIMESRVDHLGNRTAPLQGERIVRASIAKFAIGQIVRHRMFPFRGVIFDVDPQFSNTEEWWLSIPEEVRPRKDQPFYHLLAENERDTYVAYVSE